MTTKTVIGPLVSQEPRTQEKVVVGMFPTMTIQFSVIDKRNTGHAAFDGRSVKNALSNNEHATDKQSNSPQKCDEQREGDSCKTCKRLTLKCLGWGAKRPDWMRVSTNLPPTPPHLFADDVCLYHRIRKTSTSTKPVSKPNSPEQA